MICYLSLVMKLRDIYSSYLLVAGIMCLTSGVGNWIAGATQITRYQALIQRMAKTGLEDNYRSFQELDYQKNEEVLRRINEDREKYNAARVKLDFYYVVFSGGRVLFFVGLLLSAFALIRIIRRDTVAKMTRLSSYARDNPG
jgi:hypothetical protein